MTGGCVTILGDTGVNFGAGMTGGFAYVYDQKKGFDKKYNPELIDIQRINRGSPHVQQLRQILENFVEETNSSWGQHILDNFERTIKQFWLVKPKSVSVEQLLENTKVEEAVA
jgi:glutamate synthase (NADPH/NADH) large chain